MSSRLPVAVRTLLRRHVHSVGELELLLLLHAERDRSLTVGEICDALACPRSWAETELHEMDDAGLVECVDGRWRFAPSSAELARATEALQGAYRRHPREVVRFVFAQPAGRREPSRALGRRRT